MESPGLDKAGKTPAVIVEIWLPMVFTVVLALCVLGICIVIRDKEHQGGDLEAPNHVTVSAFAS